MKNQKNQLSRAQISRYFREGNRLIEKTAPAEVRVFRDASLISRFDVFISRLRRRGLLNLADYFERAHNEALEREERYYNRPRYRLPLTGELVSIYDLDREFLN